MNFTTFDSDYNTSAGFSYSRAEDAAKDEVKTIELEESTGDIEIKAKLPKNLADLIERAALREIVDEIKLMVKKKMFKKTYRSSYYSSSAGDDELNEWVMNYIKEVIADNKDEIIEQASKQLADHMRRSKVVREKFSNMLEEEQKNE